MSTRAIALQGIGFGPTAVALQGLSQAYIAPQPIASGLVRNPFRDVFRIPFRLSVAW